MSKPMYITKEVAAVAKAAGWKLSTTTPQNGLVNAFKNNVELRVSVRMFVETVLQPIVDDATYVALRLKETLTKKEQSWVRYYEATR